jgi:hypothetical protein
MSNYTVRIELHGAKHEDKVYDDLHDKMRSHRFRRTFTDKGGSDFFLATAEYTGVGLEDPFEVAKIVRGWAKEVHGGTVGVMATKQATDFGYAGEFKPTKLYHMRSTIPGHSNCGAATHTDRIRPGRSDAEDQVKSNGGELCPVCFP